MTALRSPPYTPRYNGACEAGVGSLKQGAEYFARAAGRPGEWTLDDLEAARLHANEFGRPRAASRGSPGDAWARRMRVTQPEHDDFEEALRVAREGAREEHTCEEIQADPVLRARLERAAVSTALTQLHYLMYRRY